MSHLILGSPDLAEPVLTEQNGSKCEILVNHMFKKLSLDLYFDNALHHYSYSNGFEM